MEISEKPKKTRQRKPKESTAFDEEKAKLKKTLKKKVLKDDEEPLEFDLPEIITNNTITNVLDSPTTQPKEQPKSEPINIPKQIITQTPPTPQNSYKTPVKNFILHSEYIY